MNKEFENQVKELFSRWEEGVCPGGQILIRRNHETIYEQCFGYGNLENRIPITQDSIFHIASISKQFTVLAVLLLQEDGKLHVDDDIRQYAGDLVSFKEPVTLRQMFNNVSGLRDQWELLFMRGIKINDSIDMEDVNTSVRMQETLNFPPQEGYLYSNTGFHLLAVIVERLSGKTFPDFVKERIFTPLGMDRTLIRGSYCQVIPGLAYSYQDEGSGSFYYNPLNYSLYGPTAVNTCARDLVRIISEYESPSLFSRETVDTVLKAAVLKDGTEIEYCGGMMTHMFHGMKVYEHGGADAAYRGHLLWIPEKQLEIVLLSNTTSYMASKMAKKLAALVLGLPQEADVRNVKAACPPSPGIYVTALPDDPFVMELSQNQNGFTMKREYTDTALAEQADGSYRIGSLDEYLVFHQDMVEHILPARIVKLWKAKRSDADLKLTPGVYCQNETACRVEITEADGAYDIAHPRFGKTPVYFTSDHQAIFGFGPDFVMYLNPCEDGLVMDGYRARRMVFRTVEGRSRG